MILTAEAVRLLCDSVSSVNAVTPSGTSTDHDSPDGPADAGDDNDSALLPPEDDSEIDQAEGQSGPSDTESPSSDLRKANAQTLREEQLADETLKGWWRLANLHKGNFVIRDGLLYHKKKILGQEFSQLCLPKGRRPQVLELAHDTFGGHLAAKRTRDRIRLTFTWPTLFADCKNIVRLVRVAKREHGRHFVIVFPLRLYKGQRYHSHVGSWTV